MQPNRSLVVYRLKAQLMRLLLFFSLFILSVISPTIVQALDIAEADTVDMGFLLR